MYSIQPVPKSIAHLPFSLGARLFKSSLVYCVDESNIFYFDSSCTQLKSTQAEGWIGIIASNMLLKGSVLCVYYFCARSHRSSWLDNILEKQQELQGVKGCLLAYNEIISIYFCILVVSVPCSWSNFKISFLCNQLFFTHWHSRSYVYPVNTE